MRTPSVFKCTIIQKLWLSPTVVVLRFTADSKFKFEAGQYLSIYVPTDIHPSKKPLRRLYSLNTPPDPTPDAELELCIKVVEGGVGSKYMASLNVGDKFKATGPYGDFVFNPEPEKHACFITTGTGLAPIRSIALSKEFEENRPLSSLLIFGARTEDEILYPKLFNTLGIETVHAVSQPGPFWHGFQGRVTDYLSSLPKTWHWHTTHYYLCGNGAMIEEVINLLVGGHGVNPNNILKEAYFENKVNKSKSKLVA